MKSFFKVILVVLMFLLFFALYSFIFYRLASGIFPQSMDGDFTMIFVYLLGFIMAFVKLYIINVAYEAKLNKRQD